MESTNTSLSILLSDTLIKYFVRQNEIQSLLTNETNYSPIYLSVAFLWGPKVMIWPWTNSQKTVLIDLPRKHLQNQCMFWNIFLHPMSGENCSMTRTVSVRFFKVVTYYNNSLFQKYYITFRMHTECTDFIFILS